jgi:hypothetical protein
VRVATIPDPALNESARANAAAVRGVLRHFGGDSFTKPDPDGRGRCGVYVHRWSSTNAWQALRAAVKEGRVVADLYDYPPP